MSAPPTRPHPNPAPSARPDALTVLVFKDNESARTFHVPMGWIGRLGFLLSLLAATAVFSSFFALKFYRLARKTDPTRVIDLEQELSQLKATHKQLETRLAQKGSGPVAAVPLPVAPPAPAEAPPIPLPASTATSVQASIGGVPLFTALPRNIQDLSTQAAGLPITVSPAKLVLSGKSLRVSFNLQYTATDGGSQQGRIIILARGTSALLGYPDGVLARSGGESLIAVAQGEYFSVSRFREVNAEFDQLRSAGQILDAEILILNLENQLIFYQKLAAPAAGAANGGAKAKPPVKAPKAEKSAEATTAPRPAPPAAAGDLIEPGVDQ